MPEKRVVKKSEMSRSPSRGKNAAKMMSESNGSFDIGLGNIKLGTGVKGNKKGKGKLAHKGISNELNMEKYEYYTSEDEHGRRIQKLRKK